MTNKELEIGDISNYYGGLNIKSEGGKYYWAIENWSGTNWKPIPKYLFDALIEYQKTFEKRL